MKKLLVIWSLTALATFVGLAIQQQLTRTALTKARESGIAAYRATEIEEAALKAQINELRDDQLTIDLKLAEIKAGKSRPLSNDERFNRSFATVDNQRQDPKLREFLHRQHRRMFAETHGELYRQLNLSPVKLERFKQLLVEQLEATMDVSGLLAKQGVDRNSPEGQALSARLWQEAEANIAAHLGPDDYKKYKEYSRSYFSTRRFEELQAALLERNVPPMSTDQLTVLASAVQQVESKKKNPEYAAIAGDLRGNVATQQIAQRLEAQFSPEQLQAFISYRQESDAAKKASEAFIRGETLPPTVR